MTTLFNSVSKKIFAGVALATMALASGTCMAGGCPEPGCVANEVVLDTAVQYESQKDGSEIIRIRGEKNDVLIDFTREKRKAIKEATLVATYQHENLNDSRSYEAVLLLEPNTMAVGYAGFAKVREYDGDFDTVAMLACDLENEGYEVLEFDGSGYEHNPQAQVAVGKYIAP